MPYLQVYLHIVWTTKKREKLINKTLKPLLLTHIKENAKLKDIFIEEINCVSDHIHLLVRFNAKQEIGNIIRLLKGESSHWVNKQKLMPCKFEWQDEYYASSISYSQLDRVRNYIKTQETHHNRKTYIDEYDAFIQEHDLG